MGGGAAPPPHLCWVEGEGCPPAGEPRLRLMAELRSGPGRPLPGAASRALGDAGTRARAFHCPIWHLSPICRAAPWASDWQKVIGPHSSSPANCCRSPPGTAEMETLKCSPVCLRSMAIEGGTKGACWSECRPPSPASAMPALWPQVPGGGGVCIPSLRRTLQRPDRRDAAPLHSLCAGHRGTLVGRPRRPVLPTWQPCALPLYR